MGFLIAVPATGTACLESLGWTSMVHIEVDAKVWPRIVAMEVGMAGDIIWRQTNERGVEVRIQRRCYCGGSDGQQFFLIYFCPCDKSIHSSLYGQPGASKGTPQRFVDPNNRRLTRETWWSRVLHFRLITRRLSNPIQDPYKNSSIN